MLSFKTADMTGILFCPRF